MDKDKWKYKFCITKTNTDTKTKTRPETKTKDETATGILRICAMYRMTRMIYIIYKGISKDIRSQIKANAKD